MTQSNTSEHIKTEKQLLEFCDRCRGSKIIGFDTEFVSENRYRPELCLIQVASDDEIAIIDTLAIDNLKPFWDLLTQGDHVTVVHAAREEFLFCFRACAARPKRLFDIQLAAGFIGLDYPASYSNIVALLLDRYVEKGETRTDWKQRPLTTKQIQYAIADVDHLHDLYENISTKLESKQRTSWYYEEVENWLDDLQAADSDPQWHRISGASKLNRRALAILDKLWELRDQTAHRKDRSPKRIIPDDLMIELAKRGSAKPSSFKSIRGFDSRVSRGLTDELSEAIKAGNAVPEKELPARLERGKSINMGLVGQFLSTILGVVCRDQRIAPSLVGTVQDVRKLAAWRMGKMSKKQTPKLATGWRAEIVGEAIERAIEGKVALRIADPNADNPLSIEELS